MNKVFSILAVFALLNFGYVSNSYAQEENTEATTEEATSEEVVDDSTTEAVTEEQMVEEEPMEEAAPVEEEEAAPEKSFHQVVKDKFIAGGPGFMSFVLVCLILGLAICIERILYLTMATTNTKQLVETLKLRLRVVELKLLKKFVEILKGPLPPFSTKD